MHLITSGALTLSSRFLFCVCKGSLLLWWRVPAPSALREGLVLLRQKGPASPPSMRLLLAGLLWPSMPPVAIRALLAAINSS